MKITVVGGAGAMAKAVVKDLVESEGVSEVVLADINEDESKRFAEELRARPATLAKVSSTQVDVYDHDRLVDILQGTDAAIDTTHQDCGVSVARAVINAKVNGCALGSSYTIAQETFELDEQARDAGITYLVSAGTFPGATGITAKYLADKMDQAEDVHLSMVIFRPISLTPSLVDLFLTFLPSEGLTYENGELKKVPPFYGREEIDYPKPFGRQVVYNITSSDPLTVPMAIKGIRNVCVKATYHPDYTEMLRVFHETGLLARTPVRVNGIDVVPADLLKELLVRRPVEQGREVVTFAQRAKVTGKKGSADVESIITMPFLPFEGQREDPETRATGEAGSIIVQMIARGSDRKGVRGPESCIDPKAFMQQWARRRGVEIHESWTERRRI